MTQKFTVIASELWGPELVSQLIQAKYAWEHLWIRLWGTQGRLNGGDRKITEAFWIPAQLRKGALEIERDPILKGQTDDYKGGHWRSLLAFTCGMCTCNRLVYFPT